VLTRTTWAAASDRVRSQVRMTSMDSRTIALNCI